MSWRHPVAKEALVAATAAAGVGALIAWLGPPGTDFAAHVYQRALFLQHGFTLWNDLWYDGRYSFVGYSVLYYPLAALLGIRVLAVVAATVGALALRGPPRTRVGASRALVEPQLRGHLGRIHPHRSVPLRSRSRARAARARRAPSATPLALRGPRAPHARCEPSGARAPHRRTRRRSARPARDAAREHRAGHRARRRSRPRTRPAAPLSNGNRYPFAASEAAAGLGFCLLGLAGTWRVEGARLLRYVFAAYAVAVAGFYLVPSGLGENIVRLRYVAVPVAVLVLALRRWRPLPVALGVLTLALAWNVAPLAAGWANGGTDAASQVYVWRAPLGYLRAHLQPSYRVEAVDTADHWPDFYLPEAGIPLVRGWFRQDDFPLDAILYRRFTPAAYLRWLRGLGVAYVVLARAPLDFSSVREARLIRSGRVGLRRVFATRRSRSTQCRGRGRSSRAPAIRRCSRSAGRGSSSASRAAAHTGSQSGGRLIGTPQRAA